MKKQGEPVWRPSEKLLNECNLTKYASWLKEKEFLKKEISDYEELWQWSVDHPAAFWKSIAVYFEVVDDFEEKKVMSGIEMPGCHWFEGLQVNYGGELFKRGKSDHPAVISMSEKRPLRETSWRELGGQVAGLRKFLLESGVERGDRVAAYMANIEEATASFLACASLGAIWSSCSPDFGVESVLERFQQIEPKVLIATDGYSYNGKDHDRLERVAQIASGLPDLEKVILVPFYNGEKRDHQIDNAVWWNDIPVLDEEPQFDPLPFDHPVWVLYSSGTTGAPKAITHSHGGVLMEHLKYIHLQNDVRKGEHFFWFSTTGWMMWNFVQAAFLGGATIVLYDGSPGFPDLNAMWKFIQDARINHFGTSAPFLVASMKNELHPAREFELSHLRSIGSTGSPLPPEAFEWVYQKVKKDVWLCSMSGGTDVCTAFVGSTPWKGVHIGDIQSRALGCSLHAYSESGRAVTNEVGEMVITKPMPSMPVFFWNDREDKRYKASYFEHFTGIWRHGDWVLVRDSGSLVILGRSDATLNRQGVRIGTAEIYRAIDKIRQVKDSLIVNIEMPNGDHYMPLFVVMNDGEKLTEELIGRIKKTLRLVYSPRHVPDEILECPDLPYTISGKKMEAPVKRILRGEPAEKAVNFGAMRNPDSIDFFVEFAKKTC
ncbi:MAG: acetoacetate--CoA ligase [Saprospirales bacterium]|nr:MAG: acetoacetate--CoA ligase [Saprospirales bacterium]